MHSKCLRRGTVVIWTQICKDYVRMVMGIVHKFSDSSVSIELVEPEDQSTKIVSVPIEQIRPLSTHFPLN